MNDEEKYLSFASNLSFFEFIQEEFYSAKFNVEEYKDEIAALEKLSNFKRENLEDFILEYPKSFDIFEQIFQLYRFTNTQLINFLFDIDKLNSIQKKDKIEYIFYNIKVDKNFKSIFDKKLRKNDFWYTQIDEMKNVDENLLIKILKESVVAYIKKAIKNRKIIYERIKSDEFTRTRLVNYLYKNLKIEEMIESINIKPYLKYKKIPKDTKSIHGKFGTIKIKQILKETGYENTDQYLPKVVDIDLSKLEQYSRFKNKKIYVTEKYIRNVLKRKQNKPKRFDFILIDDLKITHAIETNFYSTSGTKIGINEEEYIDLNEEIKEKYPNINFLWVTDGNYWLTKNGEQRYLRDLYYFGENILNYNQLKMRLNNF